MIGWVERMREGPRKIGQASCDVATSAAMPSKIRAQVFEITSLWTPPEFRSQGHGRALMTAVCEEADGFRAILMLTVQAAKDAQMNNARLRKWYEDLFGFRVVQANIGMMARMPQTPKIYVPNTKNR
jgi:ribosomal protein S18 acetylase RimI-like enzyme